MHPLRIEVAQVGQGIERVGYIIRVYLSGFGKRRNGIEVAVAGIKALLGAPFENSVEEEQGLADGCDAEGDKGNSVDPLRIFFNELHFLPRKRVRSIRSQSQVLQIIVAAVVGVGSVPGIIAPREDGSGIWSGRERLEVEVGLTPPSR